MNDIPQHSRRLVERLLDAYCARICPPAARNAVRLSYRVDADRVRLYELQRICGVPNTQQPVPFAEIRYSSADALWRLAFRDTQAQWRPYRDEPRLRSFLDWLREIDRDPEGIFWSRIDGKSLRWCNSHGRCNDCELKYARVLGLARQ